MSNIILPNSNLWVQFPQQFPNVPIDPTTQFTSAAPGKPGLLKLCDISFTSRRFPDDLGPQPAWSDNFGDGTLSAYQLSQEVPAQLNPSGNATGPGSLWILADYVRRDTTVLALNGTEVRVPRQLRLSFVFGDTFSDTPLSLYGNVLFRGTFRFGPLLFYGPTDLTDLSGYLSGMNADEGVVPLAEGLITDCFLPKTLFDGMPPYFLGPIGDASSQFVIRKADEILNLGAWPISYSGWATGFSLPTTKNPWPTGFKSLGGPWQWSFCGELFATHPSVNLVD